MLIIYNNSKDNFMKYIKLLALSLFCATLIAESKEKTTAEHLQDVSVTIRAEGKFSAGEGSGVIFTRKDAEGNLVNYVWTAAHVIDNLRSTRSVVVGGRQKTLVEFKDSLVVKEIRQSGRTVGRLQMDAEVLKYSDATTGHDLALLRIRKYDFVTASVTFYLDEKIPELGTGLLHVGSLLGQMGANSMTDGIYSQHGRILKSLNKYIFDQTTVTAFPGSSGGGVFLKESGEPRYIGMLVRGAGEGFNLIVPARRMKSYCEKHDIMWALDPKVKIPSEEDLKKMPIENSPSEQEEDEEKSEKKKMMEKAFPHMIRIVPLPPADFEKVEVRK